MVKSHSNLTFYARIFVVITLLIAIPCFVLLGYYYLHTLSEREQAIRISLDAQNLASLQQTNLQRMNALVQTRFNQIFASLSGRVTDPSLANAGALIGSDIAAREADFGLSLTAYQANFELATSDTMSTIRSILVNDQPATGPGIISDQQDALAKVVKKTWPEYLALQQKVRTELDKVGSTVLTPEQLTNTYNSVYDDLWRADYDFTNLSNQWQRVVDDASSMGKTIAAVGPSQTLPVYISIIFTSTILLIFASVLGFTSFQHKRSFSLYSEGENSGNTPVPPSGSIPPVPQLP